MIDNNPDNSKGVPAALSPEAIDQLCDIIVARLQGRNLRASTFQAGCRAVVGHMGSPACDPF